MAEDHVWCQLVENGSLRGGVAGVPFAGGNVDAFRRAAKNSDAFRNTLADVDTALITVKHGGEELRGDAQVPGTTYDTPVTLAWEKGTTPTAPVAAAGATSVGGKGGARDEQQATSSRIIFVTIEDARGRKVADSYVELWPPYSLLSLRDAVKGQVPNLWQEVDTALVVTKNSSGEVIGDGAEIEPNTAGTRVTLTPQQESWEVWGCKRFKDHAVVGGGVVLLTVGGVIAAVATQI